MKTVSSAGNRQIIFDLSSIANWLGPPVGIIRREHELASYALAERPDIRFSYFDRANACFVAVDPAQAARLTGRDHAVGVPQHSTRASPAAPSLTRQALDLFRQLLSRGPQAASRSSPPPEPIAAHPAFGIPLQLDRDDTIVSVGADWISKDAAAIAALKRRSGFRYVAMCHDLIPVAYPAFFPDGFARQFSQHWMTMFPIADRILVNSRTVEADIRSFCRGAGIAVGDIALVQPGCDLARTGEAMALPEGLRPGKYALFVATIEPRKGHAMLLDLWLRLLDRGVPQRAGFKLVFAGRPGWNVDELLHRIADADAFQDTLLHLADLDDARLSALYGNSAFCLLPSIYEGFGVPVVEAFAHGKAVLSSTGGALPETVGSLSPCLPATDSEAWLATIQQWIEDESSRAPYEAKIRASFAHPTWNQAAAQIFETAQ